MNLEKLAKMAAQVRTGGKGSVRRKKKAIHKTTTTDDKRLQNTLKRLGVNNIPAIEEVNLFKDNGTVIHFNNPKVQASIAANTYVVSGHAETKKLQELLPGIINQLGPDNLANLKKLAETYQGGDSRRRCAKREDANRASAPFSLYSTARLPNVWMVCSCVRVRRIRERRTTRMSRISSTTSRRRPSERPDLRGLHYWSDTRGRRLRLHGVSSRIVRTGSWLRTDAALWRAVRSIFIVKSSKFEHQHTRTDYLADARHTEPAATRASRHGAARLSLRSAHEPFPLHAARRGPSPPPPESSPAREP